MEAKIQLAFECHQDWDSMKATACGRYCDACQKEVIDFSNNDFAAIREKLKGKELCGRFLQEQLDENLISRVRFPFSRKIILFFSSLALLLKTPELGAQNDAAATGQLMAENAPDPITRGTLRIKKAEPVPAGALPERIIPYSYYSGAADPFLTTKKRMYYWSRRFPFITSIKRGRTRMGMSVRFL